MDPTLPLPSVAVMSDRPAIRAVVTYLLRASAWPDLVDAGSPADLAALPSPEPIVVLDLDATRFGVDAVRGARADARVVVLAGSASGATVLDALRAGARAYVRTPDELMMVGDVLGRVAEGDIVVRFDLQRAAIEELGLLARWVRNGVDAGAQLTPREHQVLGLLADGLTARQIGSRLSISSRTVERHASGLYRKLDVRTRVQAVARAAAIGLVDVR